MNSWQLPGWKFGILKIGNTKYYSRINIVSGNKDMSAYNGDVYGSREPTRVYLGTTSDGRILVERRVDGQPVLYVGRPYGSSRC